MRSGDLSSLMLAAGRHHAARAGARAQTPGVSLSESFSPSPLLVCFTSLRVANAMVACASSSSFLTVFSHSPSPACAVNLMPSIARPALSLSRWSFLRSDSTYISSQAHCSSRNVEKSHSCKRLPEPIEEKRPEEDQGTICALSICVALAPHRTIKRRSSAGQRDDLLLTGVPAKSWPVGERGARKLALSLYNALFESSRTLLSLDEFICAVCLIDDALL